LTPFLTVFDRDFGALLLIPNELDAKLCPQLAFVTFSFLFFADVRWWCGRGSFQQFCLWRFAYFLEPVAEIRDETEKTRLRG